MVNVAIGKLTNSWAKSWGGGPTVNLIITLSLNIQYKEKQPCTVFQTALQNISAVRFKRENPDLSLLDLKFCNMQGFGANMEISFIKHGSFMQKFAPFETFVKIT